MTYLHELSDFKDLITAVSDQLAINAGLVEKDYWIMHCLYGLKRQHFEFELKGGTSLSKGYGLIDRFSEDIDIHIKEPEGLKVGKNHNKRHHVEARRGFYDDIAQEINIEGVTNVERDSDFDDEKMRSGGIRLLYNPLYPVPEGVKIGILLETGFDQITPNRERDISSWAYDKAIKSGLTDIADNRALAIACYEPGYTLVEKLQTISTKFRRQQDTGEMPSNFLRHYYDVFCLLGDDTILKFVGSDDYNQHKVKRFPTADNQVISENEAFLLSDTTVRKVYEKSYKDISALFYKDPPEFSDILSRINEYKEVL